MNAREDVRQGVLFRSAGKRVQNWRILNSGGLRERYGSEYIDTVAGADSRLFPFIFDSDERYVIVAEDGQFTPHLIDGAGDVTTLSDVTGAAWTTSELPLLEADQAGDTMVLVHPDMVPQTVLRTGLNDFTINDFAFGAVDERPYYNFTSPGTTINPSGVSGSITLTCSEDLFVADHVGVYFRIKHGTNDWRYVQITAVTNATTADATVTDGPLDATTATGFFGEEALSDVRGYPRTVKFHEGRLWFGGTRSLPNFVLASKSDEYFNFDEGEGNPEDSIQALIASSSVNTILGMQTIRHLHIFTDQAELYVQTAEGEAITPANFQAIVQTKYGIKQGVQPVPYDGASLFIQRNGKTLREFVFQDTELAYGSLPVSLIAEDLIKDPVSIDVWRGSETRPEQFCLIVNGDGTMTVYRSLRAESVTNFVEWTTQGSYKEVCVVDEYAFYTVERSINGSDVVYLERFDEDRQLDCSYELTADPATTDWTGLTVLAGEDVQARSGNYYIGAATVNASGEVTLPAEAESVEIGLGFTCSFEALPIPIALPDGSGFGEIKRKLRATVLFDQSAYCKVDGERLIVQSVTDDFSEDLPLLTGYEEFVLRGYSRDATLTITRDLPLT